MNKAKLVTTSDPKKVPEVLRQKSKEITEITPEIFDLAKQMAEIMNKNKGIGLAAIQVGVPIRLIVVKDGDTDHALINPRLKKISRKEVVYNEGCLSFPDLFEDVARPEKVTVIAQNLDGDMVEIETGDILARVLQHEIDHLGGVVFLDRI